MNIYSSPNSNLDLGGNEKLGIGGAIACSVMSVIATFIYFSLFEAIPQFRDTFASFGSDLPWITVVFLMSHPIFAALALLSVLLNGVWLARLFNNKWAAKTVAVAKWNLVLSALLLVLGMIALYWPIFQLGRVV